MSTGSILLGIALLVAGGLLMTWHVNAWKKRTGHAISEEMYRYHRRQLFRRMQASGLIALLGVFFLAGDFLRDPYWKVAYWSAAALIVVWLIVLAVADIRSTQTRFGQLHEEYLVQKAALKEEVNRLRREEAGREGNGHAGGRTDSNDANSH